MPFTATTPARPRLVSATRHQGPSSPERPLSGRMAAATSPVRTLSGGYPSPWARPPVQHAATTPVFEPRIIRATTEPGCAPAPATAVQASPGRARRPSVRRQSTTAAPTIATSVPRTPVPPVAASLSPSSMAPTAFPRPAYLEHSALRDLLLTDAPVNHAASSVSETASVSRMSTPVPAPYPYLRRDTTPGMDTDEESNTSASPPPVSRTPAPAVAPAPGALLTNPALRLPTRWSEQDRHHLLTISPDGRELTFYGQSCSGDRDSAAARANHPIPPACGIYYYEVEILQKGAKGHISIGFSSPEVRLSRLPGWEKQSWGYHADDGWSFPGAKDGNPYGPTFDTGDIIGCGIDFTQHRAFYTKNGAFLGMVFENVGMGIDIYPSVGLRHTSESIRVNFGHAPFKYAIEDHVHAQRNAVWATIQSTPIDWDLLYGKERKEGDAGEKAEAVKASAPRGGALEEEQLKAPLRKLVLSYLAHHGYARTARAFQAQCEGRRGLAESTDNGMELDEGPRASTSSSCLDAELDLRARIDIVNAVLKGDIDTAITQTQEHHPVVLEREQGLMLFKLRCRKFVELILEASDALKRVQADEKGASQPEQAAKPAPTAMDESGAMDVDDPSPEAQHTSAASLDGSVPPAARDTSRHLSPAPAPASAAQARTALETAIAYGQKLEADYRNDQRPEVRSHLKRTFGVVAFADPLAAGGEVAEMAGQEARARLANELNQAILESQGKPAHPALETLYRQTAACVVQLGLLGVGSAAFADMDKEFLEA